MDREREQPAQGPSSLEQPKPVVPPKPKRTTNGVLCGGTGTYAPRQGHCFDELAAETFWGRCPTAGDALW